MKLSDNLKDQMKGSVEAIEELLAERAEIDNDVVQQANIFKILRLENHEIRHGAFLDYLMDPGRNPLLSSFFISKWIEQIVDELSIEDTLINDIINGEDFEVNPIFDEQRYSEILVSEEEKLRIDSALELKLGNHRRTINT